jgi:high-affinity Fe2+/Pb2+ permease
MEGAGFFSGLGVALAFFVTVTFFWGPRVAEVSSADFVAAAFFWVFLAAMGVKIEMHHRLSWNSGDCQPVSLAYSRACLIAIHGSKGAASLPTVRPAKTILVGGRLPLCLHLSFYT